MHITRSHPIFGHHHSTKRVAAIQRFADAVQSKFADRKKAVATTKSRAPVETPPQKREVAAFAKPTPARTPAAARPAETPSDVSVKVSKPALDPQPARPVEALPDNISIRKARPRPPSAEAQADATSMSVASFLQFVSKLNDTDMAEDRSTVLATYIGGTVATSPEPGSSTRLGFVA